MDATDLLFDSKISLHKRPMFSVPAEQLARFFLAG